MLKKAGIVVAAAAAGLLAVSPLAFAGESHGKSWPGEVNSYEQNSEGLINVSDTNVNAPINAAATTTIPVNVGLASRSTSTRSPAPLTRRAGAVR